MIDVLIAAIESRREIRLYYDPGERVVEPHALGYGNQGQILLRAFQVQGASNSGEHRDWKLFRIDRIQSLDSNKSTFSVPRCGYKKNDKAMRGGIIAEL